MTHTFRVYGEPAPQGSKKHVGRGIMVESSKKVKPWREAVKWAFVEDSCPMLIGPVEVSIDFFLHRPKSAKKSDLRPSRKPDLDKLVRSTFDALVEARAVKDDAQFVQLTTGKWYGHDFIGAVITLEQA